MPDVLKLYPSPQESRPLEGLYLEHDLQSTGAAGRPFVYSNFVTSLDGRIAVPDKNGKLGVPETIANDRDWRLFQELAFQADLVITSGRYLRDYEAGKSQEILQAYDDPQFEDLCRWRESRRLPPRQDLAVVSGSGDFPIPGVLRSGGRRIFVFTTESVRREALIRLEAHAEVVVAGEDSVDGASMIETLHGHGYRTIYNAAGPQVLHLLIESGSLDRLYLTQVGRVLGGEKIATLVEGGGFSPPADFRLSRLYYDPAGVDGLGQLFQVFDRVSE
jgi:riboflavin biosynthesis pyrimidine reductase